MTEQQQELAKVATTALHKLAVEIGRGTASPRAEYEWAIKRLDEMKRAFGVR